MHKDMQEELDAYCELYWWNFGKKTMDYKGSLKGLLKRQGIKFNKKKTEIEGIYTFYFKNDYGVSFKVNATINGFRHHAKQFIQMDLVRMGDKAQLYVTGSWRPLVTVNF